MKLIEKKGTTSKILHLFILDSSKSDGSGLTGLVHNSAGLTAYYIREGAASATAITLVTATIGTFTSSGFKEVDATNMPGIYELHPPNACLASGADSVVIFLKGAANMAPLPLEIQLDDNTAEDVYDRIGAPSGASIAADLVTIDGVVDAILVDTTELQTNQGNWLTATGFSVPNEYDTVIAALQTDLDNPDQYKADVSAVATAAALATHDGKLDVVDALIDRILIATEIRQASVNDAAATTKAFITTLTETESAFWVRAALLFTSGQNDGSIRAIHTYNGTTKQVGLKTALPYAPADGDTFIIIPARKFLIPDIDEIYSALKKHDNKITGLIV